MTHFIAKPNGCWIWQGEANNRGYAWTTGHRTGDRVKRRDKSGWRWKTVPKMVHRIFHETFNGDIPEGMTIDHLCGTKLCCNPDHLECVTMAENIRRAAFIRALTTRRTAKTPACPVNQALRALRISIANKGQPKERVLSMAEREEIVRRYKPGRGGGYRRLAEEFGVSHITIRYHVQSALRARECRE